MENLFIRIFNLIKFEWYTKNLTLIFFSITILGLYDVLISPFFSKVSFIQTMIHDISNSNTLLNTWNLLLLAPYFIGLSSLTLGFIYFLISLINSHIDLENVLFDYIGNGVKILLLFYPLSVVLFCIARHKVEIITSVFGSALISFGVVISIILGTLGLIFSLFTGLNIPHQRKDIF